MSSSSKPDYLLIADDDPVVQYILSAILNRINLPFKQVGTGTDCIKLVNLEPPAILFLDNQLPDISGGEVLSAIRVTLNDQALPIIMLSANSREEVQETLPPGCIIQGFLQKPFSAAEVEEVLSSYTTPGSR